MATLVKFPTSNDGGWDADEDNAYANDGTYATTSPNANSTEVVEYGTFNFGAGVGAGSVINSVTIEFEWKVSTTASTATLRVDVLVSGATVGTQYVNTTEPTTDTISNYENDYGSWDRDKLLNGTFEVRISAQRGAGSTGYTMSLDYVKVTIDYTEGGPTAYFEEANATAIGTAIVSRELTAYRDVTATAVGVPVVTRLLTAYRDISATAIGVPVVSNTSNRKRTANATAIGVPTVSRLLTAYRTATATVVGVPLVSRLLTAYKTVTATALGVPVVDRLLTAYRTITATAIGVPVVTTLKKVYITVTAVAVGVPGVSRLLTAYRSVSATAIGNAVVDRLLTAYRSVIAVAIGVPTVTVDSGELPTAAEISFDMTLGEPKEDPVLVYVDDTPFIGISLYDYDGTTWDEGYTATLVVGRSKTDPDTWNISEGIGTPVADNRFYFSLDSITHTKGIYHAYVYVTNITETTPLTDSVSYSFKIFTIKVT